MSAASEGFAFWRQAGREDELRRLWKTGLSAAQIARSLGAVTRSAVIGKARRLGLPHRSQTTINLESKNAATQKRLRAPKVKRATNQNAGLNFRTRKLIIAGNGAVIEKPEGQAPREAARKNAWAPLPGSNPRPWDQRGFKQCRWPIDGLGEDMHSCCLPTDGARYCATHARMSAPKPRSAADVAADKARRETRLQRQRRAA